MTGVVDVDQIGICRLYKNRSMSSSGTRSGREGSWGGRLKIGVGSKVTVEITKDFAVSALLLRCPAVSLPAERLRHLPTAATHFVKAQVTMLHFPQAENSDCTLAFPLPTKQALWGPRFSLPPAALPSFPPRRLFGTFLAETRKVRPRQGPEPSSWKKSLAIP